MARATFWTYRDLIAEEEVKGAPRNKSRDEIEGHGEMEVVEQRGLMNQRERFVIAGILIIVALLVGFDIITDARDGVILWHAIIEGSIGFVAISGVFFLLKGTVHLKHRLNKEVEEFCIFKKEAEAWRADSRKFIDGLALAIDQQLSKWKLTVAEKEVAFLLLKGLSLKEIAQIRMTTEKTSRVQSMAIYAKAGLSGRSELSAYFLEDLLLPAPKSDESVSPS